MLINRIRRLIFFIRIRFSLYENGFSRVAVDNKLLTLLDFVSKALKF